VAAGAGIWATHFVAMLAFKTGLPTAYDPALTLASLLIAISVTAAGFFVAGQGKNPLLPAIGGAVIGLGIGTMHYTGMRAYLTTGTVSWDANLVIASIALGVLFAAVRLSVFTGARAIRRRSPRRGFSPLPFAACTSPPWVQRS
jgi:NO-binding membrane sensor protein with MHYT domain